MNNALRKQSDTNLEHEPLLTISENVLKAIFNTIGMRTAESGGVLGGTKNSYHISHYHFDESSRNSGATYSPDCERLNRFIKKQWEPQNIIFAGFAHSHPGQMSRPSMGDQVYAERILKALDDLNFLLLPIICTIPDTGKFKLTPWVAFLDDQGEVEIVKAKIKVVSESVENEASDTVYTPISKLLNKVLDEIKLPRLSLISTNVKKEEDQSIVSTPQEVNLAQTFNRVELAYNLDIMFSSRIICVGTGGAASWIEELARAGLGQFVLIDDDIVSETNLATQQTYRCDIGRPKVDCLAERIRGINPAAKVIALQKKLDELTDQEIDTLAHEGIDGRSTRRTLICGLTDSFYAQARVNRLALQFGLPSLCAQVYQEGRGAELTFTYPGVTKACHRCILSSRYDYYLKQEKENTVTSHGTPIFSTTRLNAIKGFLTLAILHHGSNHPRWGHILKQIGNRNLIQIRMDPDFTKTIGISVFDRVFEKADQDRIFFDESIWLPQEEECPKTGSENCPDCGGTGFLRDSIGVFDDTRTMLSSPSPKITENVIRRATVSCCHYSAQRSKE